MRRSQALITTAAVLLLTVGTGSVAAAAAPYPPPATGSGKVAPSRVKQGHCTTFSGDGFAGGSSLRISDDGTFYGTTSTSTKGDFSAPVCFANDAKIGDHVLSAEGPNAQVAPSDPADRVVTATVTVTGVEQSGNGNGKPVKSNRAGNETSTDVVSPFTGAALALLLVPGITGVLLMLERRHRRRRRSA